MKPGPKPRDPVARFDRKLILGVTSGCWLWGGHIDKNTGYGAFYWNGKTGSAHRFAYETFVGPMPNGLEVDHLCRVRACVNPRHLEAVTRSVNLRRVPPRTHCLKGHEISGDNLLIEHRSNGFTQRHCRTCKRAADRVRMARWRAARKQLQGE